jgi:hypothetical protein
MESNHSLLLVLIHIPAPVARPASSPPLPRAVLMYIITGITYLPVSMTRAGPDPPLGPLPPSPFSRAAAHSCWYY